MLARHGSSVLAKWVGWLLCAGALALSGATCVPLIDLDDDGDNPPPPPQSDLSVSVLKPDRSREVPAGSVIEVEFVLANFTDDDAIVTVLVRDRADLSETVITGGLRISDSGEQLALDWDTGDFEAGTYDVVVRATAGDEDESDTSNGRVTVNGPPSLEFTEPFEDVTLGVDGDVPDPNDDADDAEPTIRIRWSGSDAEGSATADIGVDIDEDHENGNEILLDEDVALSDTPDFDSIDWNGDDAEGERVETGTYFVFAILDDELNEPVTVQAAGRITVPDEPNEPTFVTEIVQPEEDVEFLTGGDPVSIELNFEETDDVLIDVGIDRDTNHTNGNEIIILSQRLIEEGTNEDTFEWDGTDVDGAEVPDGVYNVYMVVNRGSGTPPTFDAEGLVLRRATENLPIISLLDPGTEQMVEPGQFVLIRWRDDDPDGEAEVRLTLDDDDIPNEAMETGEPELELLADRDASGDGVQDSFQYQVDALEDGEYFIFAYIDEDGAAPFDNISVAGGRLRIGEENP